MILQRPRDSWKILSFKNKGKEAEKARKRSRDFIPALPKEENAHH
jgi:hypothetical protein